MTTSNVVHLGEIRGRRKARLEKTLALMRADRNRFLMLQHLRRVVELSDADRAALVWVDEYGPGLVHPRLVLDLASDRPRRDASIHLLRRAWVAGVPGFVDVWDDRQILYGGFVSNSSLAVSLGSDGLRAWFVVADSSRRRQSLCEDAVEEIMFHAGECSAIVLHQDLDEAVEPGEPDDRSRLAAWPVLRDLDESDENAPRNRRIASRFLVVRAVWSAIEDDLSVDPESLDELVQGVRTELERLPAEERPEEAQIWGIVLDHLAGHDWERLGQTLVELGREVEKQTHWYGAGEVLRCAHEIALLVQAPEVAVEAARRMGVVQRRLGAWKESIQWYDASARLAASNGWTDQQAEALNGTLWVHFSKGDIPRSRAVRDELLGLLPRCSDPETRGSISQSLGLIAHTEGRLGEAIRHGWRAICSFGSSERRFESITAIGGALLEARQLDASSTAFRLVMEDCRDETYRLYARAGLSEVAAFRGNRKMFEELRRELYEGDFSSGTPDFRAEVLLEWGDCYLHLGDEDEARVWYAKAVEEAKAHGVAEYLIRAEAALERLDRLNGSTNGEPPAPSVDLSPEERAEILGGLRELSRSGA